MPKIESETDISNDLKRLKHLANIPKGQLPRMWEEHREQLVSHKPDQSQFGMRKFGIFFTEEGAESLKKKTIFLLWLRLRDNGLEDRANNILHRIKQPIHDLELLSKIDEFIEKTPEELPKQSK